MKLRPMDIRLLVHSFLRAHYFLNQFPIWRWIWHCSSKQIFNLCLSRPHSRTCSSCEYCPLECWGGPFLPGCRPCGAHLWAVLSWGPCMLVQGWGRGRRKQQPPAREGGAPPPADHSFSTSAGFGGVCVWCWWWFCLLQHYCHRSEKSPTTPLHYSLQPGALWDSMSNTFPIYPTPLSKVFRLHVSSLLHSIPTMWQTPDWVVSEMTVREPLQIHVCEMSVLDLCL